MSEGRVGRPHGFIAERAGAHSAPGKQPPPHCVCITASALALNLTLNAGPRVLEHIVDTVVYMEGGRQQPVRLVRVRRRACAGLCAAHSCECMVGRCCAVGRNCWGEGRADASAVCRC